MNNHATAKLVEIYKWFSTDNSTFDSNDLAPTRDVFHARLQNHLPTFPEEYLLFSVIGEIGNNAFDHNLGKWNSTAGCLMHMSKESDFIHVSIADRGQGFRRSLEKVAPDVKSDQDAIEVAFSRRVSGRAPERRGNGLK